MKKLFDLIVLIIVSPFLLLLWALVVVSVILGFLLGIAFYIPSTIVGGFLKTILRNNSIYDASNIKVNSFKKEND